MNLPPAVNSAVARAATNANLSPYALLQKTNTRRIVEARREVFIELYKMGFSLAWIGRWFNLTHATVLHHIRREPNVAVRVRPREPRLRVPKLSVPDFHCDRCGFRGPAGQFIPEHYHHICRDTERCNGRYEFYIDFRQRLAEDLRHRYIETAYRSSNLSHTSQSNQVVTSQH